MPALAGCNTSPPEPRAKKAKREAMAKAPDTKATSPEDGAEKPPHRDPHKYRLAHVFVALCDNAHQGIVKVPPALGNGQEPAGNLYWGAPYGVKTFFSKSADWAAVPIVAAPKNEAILDRCVFRSTGKGRTTYVIAEAYDGSKMPAALQEFFNAAAGRTVTEFDIPAASGKTRLQAGGYADLVAFVGHNGLMDIQLDDYPEKLTDDNPGAAVVLACKSRKYFEGPLGRAGCRPLVLTSQFMAPEAYTLDAILRSWGAGDAPDGIARKAALAYAKYQKIKPATAQKMFVVPVEPRATAAVHPHAAPTTPAPAASGERRPLG
jgi:hypothetical protein